MDKGVCEREFPLKPVDNQHTRFIIRHIGIKVTLLLLFVSDMLIDPLYRTALHLYQPPGWHQYTDITTTITPGLLKGIQWKPIRHLFG